MEFCGECGYVRDSSCRVVWKKVVNYTRALGDPRFAEVDIEEVVREGRGRRRAM